MKGNLDDVFKRIVMMTSLTHGNVFLNCTFDWVVIFHTFSIYALAGSGKLQFMLELILISEICFVNRLLKRLETFVITLDFPIENSFENPAGISPFHGVIVRKFSLGKLFDLIGELFDGVVCFVLIFHTLIMAARAKACKRNSFSFPIAGSFESLYTRRIIRTTEEPRPSKKKNQGEERVISCYVS